MTSRHQASCWAQPWPWAPLAGGPAAGALGGHPPAAGLKYRGAHSQLLGSRPTTAPTTPPGRREARRSGCPSHAVTRGSGPRTVTGEPGVCPWLPKGERRWGWEDTRKPDCALCPRTRAGCVRGPRGASCRTYLARNHPTHLPARRISPKACERPKAETPTGEQKALSVEGGKPGSGRRPPVPMGPARQRSAGATWGGTPLHSTPPSPLNAPGGSSERNTTHRSAASLPVPAHTRRLPRNGAL